MGINSVDACSYYMDCSDAMKCVLKDDPFYKDCTYRKRLEAGICYYGKNRCLTPKPILKSPVPKSKPKIYLTCYNRPFAVLRRSSNTYSYELDEEKSQAVIDLFALLDIPYRTKLDIFEALPGNEVEVIGPCNSRVVFKVNDSEYHILNFNSYLIQNWYAEKINKSLISKGITSRVELIGTYINTNSYLNSIAQRNGVTDLVKKEIAKEVPHPVQLTLFDLSEFIAPARRR